MTESKSIRRHRTILFSAVWFIALQPCAGLCGQGDGKAGRSLRLVPWPKQIQLTPARLSLHTPMIVQVSDAQAARQGALDLKEKLAQIAHLQAKVESVPLANDQTQWYLTLSAEQTSPERVRVHLPAIPDREHGYRLAVYPEFATVGAKSEAGLVWGIQTLRQLIRANLKDNAIPGVTIRDWPSLRYRGFQDDLTRGPSSKPQTLQREIRIGSLLKINFFTYYMEHQFAFARHPLIGPKGGSLTAAELRSLVKYAKRYGLEIIGNQQSFGHFREILKHDAYKHLRETDRILNPTDERTYQLLDDLYAEQIPLLESDFFNVCCDETFHLGEGPSKPVADRIGVGGLYAGHMQRVHDLVTGKYGKRMMMWGDIILRHPEHLEKIPKDTVMLSWGYHAAPSFEPAIVPFAESGYDFFVCPGVNCWGRILPDFDTAVTNIHNYVRDGAKHGAMGVLNTTWDDDGENFFAPNWHGVAWGAECAWNASTTSIEDFNRRIGAVLFGGPGDHFGQAIELLGKTHRLDGYDRMMDTRFWKIGIGPEQGDQDKARKQARALLQIVDPALEHLHKAKDQAKVNADLLDYFIFGTERMRLMATRSLDVLEAVRAWTKAGSPASRPGDALALLRTAEQKLQKARQEHERLKRRYTELWHRENKPYALDRVTRRFDALLERYDAIIAKLQQAITDVEDGRELPPAGDVQRRILELGAVLDAPEAPDRTS